MCQGNMNKNISTTRVEQRKGTMRRPKKKRSKYNEKVGNKSEALKKDMDARGDDGILDDDEATKELDMMLILSEAVI